MSEPSPDRSGVFITLEGGEAAGKSTQLTRAAEWLAARGYGVVSTREPGGTLLGDSIRSLLLQTAEPRTPLTELFLLLADRSHHVSETIRPALDAGQIVLCDRYSDSSLAYQAVAGGLGLAKVRQCCSLATGDLWPDLTFVLDFDPETSWQRLHRPLDRMERKGLVFHRQVRRAFLMLAEAEPGRFCVIDAAQKEDVVARRVQDAISRVLLRRSLPSDG
jgi:dTMP kinase